GVATNAPCFRSVTVGSTGHRSRTDGQSSPQIGLWSAGGPVVIPVKIPAPSRGGWGGGSGLRRAHGPGDRGVRVQRARGGRGVRRTGSAGGRALRLRRGGGGGDPDVAPRGRPPDRP